MTTLAQLGEGLERALGSIAEGWRQLRHRAGHALTHFSPGQREGELVTADEQFMRRASRWGLLAADVSENDREVIVRLEAPGLDPADFDIQVINSILVVRGQKEVQREQTEGLCHVMECAYGSFERAVPLPSEVDENEAQASYRRGVLQVRLPRIGARRARRIEVQHQRPG